MNTFLLPSLNKAVNAYLALDPDSRPRIEKLQGKIVVIELLPFHIRLLCTFTDSAMQLKDVTADMDTFSANNIHTIISGTPLQMMGVMLNKDKRHQFFADDVRIEGSAEIGQQVIELFDELRIDWEDHLSAFIGDTPAYHAGRFITKIRGMLRHTDESLSQSINEYIHEEAEWLPSREALQDFFNDIDIIRMDVDRAEARLHSLQQALMNNEDKQ